MSEQTRQIPRTIRLDARDNVVVARKDIPAGTELPEEGITTLTEVPAGYKVAAIDIKKGEAILKYDTVIGYAAEDTKAGTMMHSHNINFDDVELDYAFCRDYKPVELLPESQRRTFMGFRRADGRVGTRNIISIPVAGNCGGTVARKIAEHFTPEVMKNYPHVDAVVPFITGIGCGMEMTGDSMDMLRRTIAGYCTNPNVAGALLVALGCERNNIDGMIEQTGLKLGPMMRRLVIQEEGGTRKSVEKGIKDVYEMLEEAEKCRREEVSAEYLTVALQCGGSDGFSGLSANPALGKAVDILVKNGGTAILAEITELYGVEHTFTRRSKTREAAQAFIDRLDWWKNDYNKGKDTQINGRVSPGNNKGGLANVLEKSLGGAKKGGSTPMNAFYQYAETVTEKGLVIMDSPGYDPVSVTGEFAGGATICCFTTGRGSCFGTQNCPTIKLATNTPMYNHMEEDMDINCGQIIDGEKTLDEMGRIIFEEMLAVASGKKTKSEALGVGMTEYVPWQSGCLA